MGSTLPDATGLELIAQRVRESVGEEAVTDTVFYRGRATLDVAPQSVHDVIAYLRDEDEEPWERLMSVHGVDYLPAEPRLGVHYELLSMARTRPPERAHARGRGRPARADASWTSTPPRTSRSARSTTCSAWSSRATPTCAAS